MIAIPWYLLSAGIVILLIGLLAAGLSGSARPPLIDPRMRDDEIARNLQRSPGSTLANLMILLGGLCILVSIIWRVARYLL